MIRRYTKQYLLLLVLSQALVIGSAFVSQVNQRTFHCCTARGVASAPSMSVQDSAGTEITVGSIVRVAVPDLRAYQINSKSFGSYDESSKSFLPLGDKESIPRKERCLKVPVGMRGEVTKVYDAEELSANLPIQVKFTPGQTIEEGYDPPTAFLMHFALNEVEVV